jgi:hypothetical protein
LTPRFTVRERPEIEAAAAAVGMTANGFCAAALTAARRMPMSYGGAQDREALAWLQRQLFEARTAVNRFGALRRSSESAIDTSKRRYNSSALMPRVPQVEWP